MLFVRAQYLVKPLLIPYSQFECKVPIFRSHCQLVQIHSHTRMVQLAFWILGDLRMLDKRSLYRKSFLLVYVMLSRYNVPELLVSCQVDVLSKFPGEGCMFLV